MSTEDKLVEKDEEIIDGQEAVNVEVVELDPNDAKKELESEDDSDDIVGGRQTSKRR